MRVLIVNLVLLSCASPTGIVKLPDRTIIQHHRGGHILSVMQELAASPQPFQVQGYCASACTYVLSFEGTCVENDSLMVFHEATARTPRMQKAWTRIMYNWYPEKLQRHLERQVPKRGNIVFTGAELNKYFGVTKCKREN